MPTNVKKSLKPFWCDKIMQLVEFQEPVNAGDNFLIPPHVPIPVMIKNSTCSKDGFSAEEIMEGLIYFFALGENSQFKDMYRGLAEYINPFLVEYLLTTGSQYAIEEQREYAEVFFKALIGFYPESIEGNYNLGLLYHNWTLVEGSDEMMKNAFELMKKTIQLNSEFPEPYYNCAVICFESGETLQCKEYITKFISLSKDERKINIAKNLLETVNSY